MACLVFSYIVLSLYIAAIHKYVTMPKRYVATRCNTMRGNEYSLHAFPHEQDLHAKWVQAVKKLGWLGP